MRGQLLPQIVEALIDDRLLDEDAEKNGISVTDDELRAEFEKGLRDHLVKAGISREEFADQVQARLSLSLDDFVKERSSDPGFRRTVVHERLFEKRFPDVFAVSPEEIGERYERDLQKIYTKPEMVRASHILIETNEGMSEEQRNEAHQRAEDALARANAPDADFAALAKEMSACPSKAQGGDLGFFPREGAMVEPFALAAFALQPGEISDVVETRFGYHVIKVTERKKSTVVSLEDATQAITDELRQEKMGNLRSDLVAELRKTATIVYADGKAPQANDSDGG
jgi:peptidyl-prolyl cis-trans isomerase C